MMREESSLVTTARTCTLAAVVAAPWLFGGEPPWAYLLLCLLCAAGVGAWLLHLVAAPGPALRAPLASAFLVALLALTLLQLVPLPESVVRAVGPLSADARNGAARSFEALRRAGAPNAVLPDQQPRYTVSAAPSATRHSLYLLAACVAVFIVAANAYREWRHLRGALLALTVSGFTMAVVGITHKFSGSDQILWFHRPRLGGSVFGPFSNPNHYAAHVNMLFGAGLGLLLAVRARSLARGKSGWRGKLAYLSTARGSRTALLGFALAILAGSVAVSLSRGGMVSLAGAAALVGLGSALVGRSRSGWKLAATVVLLAVGAAVWIGREPAVREMGSLARIDLRTNSRIVATRATLKMFGAAPLFGSGFGAFQYVFPAFQQPSIRFGRWLHAHNDYAQLLAEGGIVGGLLALGAVVCFVVHAARLFGRAPARARMLAGGLSVGLAAIAIHSFVDYSLRRPANMLLLAALAGMMISALNLPGAPRRRTTSDHEAER